MEKRDRLAADMRESDGMFIKSDLAEYHRAGGGTPLGANYSFAFLWDSLRRRVRDNEQQEQQVKYDNACEAEIQKVLNQAKLRSPKAAGNALPASLSKKEKKAVAQMRKSAQIPKGNGQSSAFAGTGRWGWKRCEAQDYKVSAASGIQGIGSGSGAAASGGSASSGATSEGRREVQAEAQRQGASRRRRPRSRKRKGQPKPSWWRGRGKGRR